MEIVIAIALLAALWILRKTIRVWSSVSEITSDAKARQILVNVAKDNIHTTKEVQALMADNDVALNLDEVDSFLFDGTLPKVPANQGASNAN